MKIDLFHPSRKYRVIYADPPWNYNDKHCNGGSENHYASMTLEELKQLPIAQLSKHDSILFLWCTYPMLPNVPEVMKAWGFQYKTIGFQWVKQNRNNPSYFVGLGRYTRGNTEGCFIGVKGRPPIVNHSVKQLVVAPRQNHSRKPQEVRDRIVTLCGNVSRVELFARERVPGWDCWGNEV